MFAVRVATTRASDKHEARKPNQNHVVDSKCSTGATAPRDY